MRKLIIARSATAMEQLRPAWEKLSQSHRCTAFQRFDWNHAVADRLRGREAPCVVYAESDSGAAMIPAAIALRSRQLTLLGEELFDYREILTAGDDDSLSRAWQALSACGLPFAVNGVRKPEAMAWLPCESQYFSHAPALRVSTTAIFSHCRLARNLRKLERRGCKMTRFDGRDLARFRRFYQWKAARTPDNLFCAPDRIEAVCALAAATPKLWEVFVLEHGAEAVAGIVSFIDGEWRRFYTVCYDQTWARYSPGLTLLHDVTRQSLEAGHNCDYLTGDQPYKARLANSFVPLHTVRASVEQMRECRGQ